MSSIVTNPNQTSPSVLAEETYDSMLSGYKNINDQLVAAYTKGVLVAKQIGQPPPPTPLLFVVSYQAILTLENLAQAVEQPTAAQLAAVVTQIPYNAPPPPPPAPPFSLGPQIAPGVWILLASGNYPTTPTININGIQYIWHALTPFEYVAQVAPIG